MTARTLISELARQCQLCAICRQGRDEALPGSYDWRHWSDKLRSIEAQIEHTLDHSMRLS